jgi:hypothetical protein
LQWYFPDDVVVLQPFIKDFFLDLPKESLMSNNLSLLTWLLTFFCWTPLVNAVSPSFAETDADMNGHLSRAEVAQIKELNFTEADKNQDGLLNLEEYVSATTKAID